MRGLLIGLCGLGVLACRSLSYREPAPGTAVLILPESVLISGKWSRQTALAETRCDARGRPVIFVRQFLLEDSLSLHYILIHEEEHVRWVDSVGIGCAAFMRRYTSDGDFMWDVEAAGYCATYVARRRDHNLHSWDWTNLKQLMWRYDSTLKWWQIDQFLPCTEQ